MLKEENISNRLNRLKKRSKCQSSNIRNKKPSQMRFQFKSSLFTEKNRSLIEKLVSQSVSPENSFSKEKIKDKERNKPKKYSTTTKAKNTIITSNNKTYNQRIFQNINNYKKKIFCKQILKNKINSTFSQNNSGSNCNINNKNNSIINCQIQPIKKRNIKIKITNNNNIQKKKIVFNSMANRTRNNSVKVKLNFNLNSSVKYIYEPKKINGSVKNVKPVDLKNSLQNKNNTNMITVNTISLKNRKSNINNMKLVETKKKPKIITNKKNRNSFHYH